MKTEEMIQELKQLECKYKKIKDFSLDNDSSLIIKDIISKIEKLYIENKKLKNKLCFYNSIFSMIKKDKWFMNENPSKCGKYIVLLYDECTDEVYLNNAYWNDKKWEVPKGTSILLWKHF